MKSLTMLLLCAVLLTGCVDGCFMRAEAGATGVPAEAPRGGQALRTGDGALPALRVRVGESAFSMSLHDGDAARALLERLPLTIEMNELNGNEKYHYFEDAFPTAAERVENIRAGDLMLYGDDCLVLFYKGFPTPYSYTRLGFMEHVGDLEEALGAGQARVTFEVDD